MNWLLAPWHAVQRRIDLQLLWPAIKREGEQRSVPLDDMRAAFAFHAYQDTAWLALGEAEIARRIELLE